MAVQKLLTRVLTPSGTVLVPCVIPMLFADDHEDRSSAINEQVIFATGQVETPRPTEQFYSSSDTGVHDSNIINDLASSPEQLGFVIPQNLPIYGSPQGDVPCPACEAEKTEAKDPSQLLQGVSKVRKTVVNGVDNLKIEESKERVFDNFKIGIARVKSAYEYLTSEDNYLPRAAAITSGGLVGLLMARKGGAIKKIFYTSTGLTAMSSICYPKQAVVISEDLYKIGKYYAIVAYQKLQEAGENAEASKSKPKLVAIDTLATQVSDVHQHGFRLEELSTKPPANLDLDRQLRGK